MVLELGILLAVGFAAVRIFEYLKAQADDSRRKAQLSPWMKTFPVTILAISFSFTSSTTNMSITYQILAIFVAIMMMPLLNVLRPSRWRGPVAFGVRGCILAIFSTIAIRAALGNASTSVSPSLSLHYLSLICFALASWNIQALSGIGAFDGDPKEQADVANSRCSLFLLVQIYFALGFIFSYHAHSAASASVS